MNNICSRCNKIFKYDSLLKRHLERKKLCIQKNISNTEQINNTNLIEDNIENIIQTTNDSKADILNSIIKHIKLSKNEVIELLIKIINNSNNNDNDIEIKNNNIEIKDNNIEIKDNNIEIKDNNIKQDNIIRFV